ncbi:hypothetical protein EON79_06315 [bacterium]|nr:MAG: hypothetical protein EON79_06315 [bacterium]
MDLLTSAGTLAGGLVAAILLGGSVWIAPALVAPVVVYRAIEAFRSETERRQQTTLEVLPARLAAIVEISDANRAAIMKDAALLEELNNCAIPPPQLETLRERLQRVSRLEDDLLSEERRRIQE